MRDCHPKNRQASKLQRKKASKKGDRYLIVCEGKATEPNYLNELRRSLKLPKERVQILHGDCTDPIGIVEYAYNLFEQGNPHLKIEKHYYDKIFVAFDRDQHDSYDQAITQSKKYHKTLSQRKTDKGKASFEAITSNPSFELWLLLHFQEVNAPMTRQDVLQRLRQIDGWNDYDKGKTEAYLKSSANLDAAQQRANRLLEQTSDNPKTNFGILVRTIKDAV
jgi:hypothetical protein